MFLPSRLFFAMVEGNCRADHRLLGDLVKADPASGHLAQDSAEIDDIHRADGHSRRMPPEARAEKEHRLSCPASASRQRSGAPRPRLLLSTPYPVNAVAEEFNVRYLVDDVDAAVSWYTKHLGFHLRSNHAPAFADVTLGSLRLLLSGPTSSAGRPMQDGERPVPGRLEPHSPHSSRSFRRGFASEGRRRPVSQ